MTSNSGQQPVSTEPTPVEKSRKQVKSLVWLYILLAIGIIVVGVGIALVFLLK